MHLMALGMFLFQIGTLGVDELQRRSDWQHARSPRIGARDAAQFLGRGDETISLSGTIYTELADGRVSLDELRTMADAGETVPLVGGDGTIWGSFVLLSIDEKHTSLMTDGTPRRIDFGIELLRLDDPAPAAAEPAA
jgi:phage protein U